MSTPSSTPHQDVVVIGAGAAGLATAIVARRAAPRLRVLVLDGARTPGAKILVSGGSRCNVTNAVVTDRDFSGGTPGAVRRVLRALPVPATVAFFRSLGVELHEEAGGKLFPNSNRARDVLEGLLKGLHDSGAVLRADHRVRAVTPHDEGFEVVTSQGVITTRTVVLATGGLALPKSGSDGIGYTFAERLGHSLVPTTPALVPLCFDPPPAHAWLRALTGIAHPVRVTVHVEGRATREVAGAMLWTHFGVSGPAVLDVSRHWLRARLEGRAVTLAVNLVPTERFDTLETRWLTGTRRHPKMSVATVLAESLPGAVGAAFVEHLGTRPSTALAEFTRDTRRALAHRLVASPLPVVDSRGYTYAEATAGGVPLDEINVTTMESRLTPGVYLVGEILDVDGRIGGFNFQWAWASGTVAGRALASRTV